MVKENIMKVRELIEELNKLDNKEKHVAVEMFIDGIHHWDYAISVNTSNEDDTVYISD